MQVGACGVRRPFVANERRKIAGVIVFLGRINGHIPGRLERCRTRHRREGRRKRVGGKGLDDLDGDLHTLLPPGLDHVVPTSSRGIPQHVPVTGVELREEAHVVRVIRHDQEVQRPVQPDELAGRRGELLTAGETVGVLRHQPGSEGARVHGHARVQVRVAPVHVRREVPSRVRREVLHGRKRALEAFRRWHRILGAGEFAGDQQGCHRHAGRENPLVHC